MNEKKYNVEIIVFLYNGLNFINLIKKEIQNQKTHFKLTLKYVVTDTNDGSIELLKQEGCEFSVVKKENFSHSLTREKEIAKSKADAVVLLSQDCRLVNNDVIEKLVGCLNDEVKYAYVRQVNSNKSIERYSRMINYPLKSIIKDKNSISSLGLNTFFASDACSCVDVDFFTKINGYDKKDLPTNEDMYYARKVIMNGKKVEYMAETFVDHTHKFTLSQIRKRYFLVGRFFSICPEFKEYHSSLAGLSLANKILILILKEFNLSALFMFIPNMLARYLGKRNGEREGKKEIARRSK